jgi:hypothetical protein
MVLENTVCTAEAISDMLRLAEASSASTCVSCKLPEVAFKKVLRCFGPNSSANASTISALLSCVVNGGTLFLFEPVTAANEVRNTKCR